MPPEKATASNEKSAIYHGLSINKSSASPIKLAVNKKMRGPAISVKSSSSHVTATTPKESKEQSSKNKQRHTSHEITNTTSLNNGFRKNIKNSGTDHEKQRSKRKNNSPHVVKEATTSLNNSSKRNKCSALQQNVWQSYNSETSPVAFTGYNPVGSHQNSHLPSRNPGEQVPAERGEFPSASRIPVVYIPITSFSQQSQFNNTGVSLASPLQPLMYFSIPAGMNQVPVQPIQMASNMQYLVSSPQNTTGFFTTDQNTVVQNSVGQLNQVYVPSAVMQGFQFSTISPSNNVQTFAQVM